MVPQDDVLHKQLKVRTALRFAAALRFADDVPRKVRWAKVNEVMETMRLTERAKQRIDTLSGGQRKRASVAMELLTEPSLLCLDEPTSGLDPALDKEVMRELRELADKGKTVVVVTHSVLHLDLCDRVLVMCLGGTMGYFGPPDQLLALLRRRGLRRRLHEDHRRAGAVDPRLPQLAAVRPLRQRGRPRPTAAAPAVPARWRRGGRAAAAAVVSDRDGRRSERCRRRHGDAAAPTSSDRTPRPVAGAAACQLAAADASPTPPPMPSVDDRPWPGPGPTCPRPSPAGRTWTAGSGALFARNPSAPLRQYFTLCLRMINVILSDRGFSAFLLAMPLILAVLAYTVPGDKGLAFAAGNLAQGIQAQQLLVVLVTGAAFLGTAAAIREIVNEAADLSRGNGRSACRRRPT